MHDAKSIHIRELNRLDLLDEAARARQVAELTTRQPRFGALLGALRVRAMRRRLLPGLTSSWRMPFMAKVIQKAS